MNFQQFKENAMLALQKRTEQDRLERQREKEKEELKQEITKDVIKRVSKQQRVTNQ
jgi:hypothetical protein